ncbi:MAG TPA: MFS transporter, partial [Pirellulales bacterium]|nr:MFS transporter [Pirellulales bacterium]
VAESDVGKWLGIITASFLVGAATGGVLFGWLGDRIGRVRAMTLSVLVYALFTGLCGVAHTAWQVGILRFVSSLGIGGEWSLGVALVMEVWPNRSRALMAGLIGAAANVGFLLVGAVGFVVGEQIHSVERCLSQIGLSAGAVETLISHEAWRFMMLVGAAPAALTVLIRVFVPESQRWRHEQQRGGTSHWATRDLLGVLLGSIGPALIIFVWAEPRGLLLPLAATLLGVAIAVVGYSYPVVRYLQREGREAERSASAFRSTLGRMLLAAGLSGVPLLATWAGATWAPSWADKMTGGLAGAKEQTQMYSAFGAVVGTVAAALLGGWLGRRVTYALLCVSSVASLIWLYQFNPVFGTRFLLSAFVVGMCTASFYGWLPLYLPELFRTGVRATCQGFGYNFGRILAAVGALQTGNLMNQFPGDVVLGPITLAGGYPLACSSMSLIYLVGLVLICFAPETRGKPLPE